MKGPIAFTQRNITFLNLIFLYCSYSLSISSISVTC